MMLRIVGLSYEKFFYQVKINGEWRQFTKSISDFIHMMFVLFPNLAKDACLYAFDNKYSIANWLYNYGENVKPWETYIFYKK